MLDLSNGLLSALYLIPCPRIDFDCLLVIFGVQCNLTSLNIYNLEKISINKTFISFFAELCVSMKPVLVIYSNRRGIS